MKPTIALVHGAGESCNFLAGRFPGSTLGDTLRPVPRGDGTTDLYIVQDRSRSDLQLVLTAFNSLASRPERTTHEH